MTEPTPSKKGYLVVSWSSKECYLSSLREWVHSEEDAHFFANPRDAIHTAECHSYFSCRHLEVVYSDKNNDILDTIYRTEYPNSIKSDFVI